MTLKEQFYTDRLYNNSVDIFTLIERYHKEKFPNIDVEKQEQKLLAEIHEFEASTTTENKVEETVDIIISAIGLLTRLEKQTYWEVVEKFEKVLDREYPDQMQHKEEEND